MSKILSETRFITINLSFSKNDLLNNPSLKALISDKISDSSYLNIFLEKIGFRSLSITSSINPLFCPYKRKKLFFVKLQLNIF